MPKPKKLKDLDLSREALAQLMDFSVLNSDASRADIDKGIELSLKYHFKGFHTNTFWSAYVAERVAGSGIEAGWPVAFPFGCVSTEVKIAEAKEGARLLKGKPWVIDMVANSGMLKTGEYDFYKHDIAEIVKIAHDGGAECKPSSKCSFCPTTRSRPRSSWLPKPAWTGSNPPPAATVVPPCARFRSCARPRPNP
jgi:deoxyribose-phosphate aldolase